MLSHYTLYKKAFIKFAQSTLDGSERFSQISTYAINLQKIAEWVVKKASLNRQISLEDFQRDISEIGREYIHKFSEKFRQCPCCHHSPNLKGKQVMVNAQMPSMIPDS